MKNITKHAFKAAFVALTIALVSCNEDGEDASTYEIPTTYTFERNGASSVAFTGQTTRLDMLSEIKAYLVKGDRGEAINADALLNMFANENSPFTNTALNSASVQIENKTFASDIQFYKDQFESAAATSIAVSQNGTMADEGIAGSVERGNTGVFVNVDGKGWEHTQIIEKGLMGAFIYHQIFNTYLTDARIGASVDNVNLVEGQNYTALEHHWDEAFGYWSVPIDFPGGDPVLTPEENRFWANYTNGRNALLGVNQPLMNAYLTGRAAIVANDRATMEAQVEIIYELHELVTAATAVHYINSSLEDLSANDTGNLFHHLSEAWAFVNAIRYSPKAALTSAQIATILESDFGTDGDFWTVTANGLNNAKSTLAATYPEMSGVIDDL